MLDSIISHALWNKESRTASERSMSSIIQAQLAFGTIRKLNTTGTIPALAASCSNKHVMSSFPYTFPMSSTMTWRAKRQHCKRACNLKPQSLRDMFGLQLSLLGKGVETPCAHLKVFFEMVTMEPSGRAAAGATPGMEEMATEGAVAGAWGICAPKVTAPV